MKKDKGPSVAKKVGMKIDALVGKHPLKKAPVGIANKKGPDKHDKKEPKKPHKG
jgi:hypothetical protein